MTANELADVFNTYDEPHDWGTKAATMLRNQQAEIEEWKRKYKDMHNLATQAMSRVHELKKAKTNEQ
jgi:hypothetical protein